MSLAPLVPFWIMWRGYLRCILASLRDTSDNSGYAKCRSDDFVIIPPHRIIRATLGDIFLKNLFLKCFWWALRNKEFDFFNFKEGGIRCFLRYRSENDLFKRKNLIIITTFKFINNG